MRLTLRSGSSRTIGAVGLAIVGAACVAGSVRAQPSTHASVGLDVLSTTSRVVGDAGFLMRSTLDLEGAPGRLMLGTRMRDGLRGIPSTTLDVDATVLADAPWGRGRLELTGWRVSNRDESPRGAVFGAQLRAHVIAPSRGIWVALGSQRTTWGDDASMSPTATIGGWMRKRGISMSTEISQFRAPASRGRVMREVDTLSRNTDTPAPVNLQVLGSEAAPVFPESTFTPNARPSMPSCSCRPDMVWGSAALVSMHWTTRRFELSGTGSASVTRGMIAERWAAAEATLWVTPSIGLVANGRRQAFEPGSGGSRGNTISLGLRVASIRQSPRVLPLVARPTTVAFNVSARGARSVLEIRAPGARTVEIRGDFTGWEPVPATRTRQGWELVLPLDAGVHQVLLSIDGGAWLPPPGLPTAPDGFGGVAGVLVIDR